MKITRQIDGLLIEMPFRAKKFGTALIGLVISYLCYSTTLVFPIDSLIHFFTFLVIFFLGFCFSNILWFRIIGCETLEVRSGQIYFYRNGIWQFDKAKSKIDEHLSLVKFIDSGLPDMYGRGDVTKGTVNGKLVVIKGNQEYLRFGTYLSDDECNTIIEEFKSVCKSSK